MGGGLPPVRGPLLRQRTQSSTLIARAMTRAMVASAIEDCTSMTIFAQGARGSVSVGLEAVALVKDGYG